MSKPSKTVSLIIIFKFYQSINAGQLPCFCFFFQFSELLFCWPFSLLFRRHIISSFSASNQPTCLTSYLSLLNCICLLLGSTRALRKVGILLCYCRSFHKPRFIEQVLFLLQTKSFHSLPGILLRRLRTLIYSIAL